MNPNEKAPTHPTPASQQVSPEAGVDRNPQNGQAKHDPSLTAPSNDLPDGAVGSTHNPKGDN